MVDTAEEKAETLLESIKKNCSKCRLLLDVKFFSKDIRTTTGTRSQCNQCISITRKIYYKNNHKFELRKMKEWQDNNKDYLISYRKNRNQNSIVKAKKRSYIKYKLKTDINFKIKERLYLRTFLALKKGFRQKHILRDLGCTIQELKIYLESKFQEGMNWDNYGFRGWHIDHIKPLSKFDLTDRKQFLEACNYTNLQPLWWLDNLRKHTKLVYK